MWIISVMIRSFSMIKQLIPNNYTNVSTYLMITKVLTNKFANFKVLLKAIYSFLYIHKKKDFDWEMKDCGIRQDRLLTDMTAATVIKQKIGSNFALSLPQNLRITKTFDINQYQIQVVG